MPKPRTPTAKAKAAGREIIHAGRYKDRSDPKTAPLGAASTWMEDEFQIRAWESFKREIPWLAESDRPLVELACTVRGRLIKGEDVGVQALNLLRQCLGSMGATPADRSKVNVPDGNEEDPEDALFNRPN